MSTSGIPRATPPRTRTAQGARRSLSRGRATTSGPTRSTTKGGACRAAIRRRSWGRLASLPESTGSSRSLDDRARLLEEPLRVERRLASVGGSGHRLPVAEVPDVPGDEDPLDIGLGLVLRYEVAVGVHVE